MTLNRQDLTKLAEEAKKLADWTAMRDFANQVYGEDKAVKVEIETYGEYNDEGGTSYRIESIDAYDKNDNKLEVDYSLPFFKSKIWADNTDEDERFLWNYQEAYGIKEEANKWVLFEDIPMNDEGEIFDLTVEPKLSLPV